jgi:hypothetical protein
MRTQPSAAGSRRPIIDRPTFGMRLARDIDAKRRLIARMKLQM